jgi:hypothetical protein
MNEQEGRSPGFRQKTGLKEGSDLIAHFLKTMGALVTGMPTY